MVGHGEKEIAEGNYWEISVPSYLDGEYYHLVGQKDFPAVKTLEPGKMYRLNIDLEPESQRFYSEKKEGTECKNLWKLHSAPA